jgi:hypothetical protein
MTFVEGKLKLVIVNFILMFLSSQGGLSKEDVELVVCHLIIEGYIKEDFHFTPYSTIRYRVLYYRWNFQEKGAFKYSRAGIENGAYFSSAES